MDDGFVGDGYSCEDVDECEGTNDCAVNAMCHNLEGSYECECNEGFTGDDGRLCFESLDRCEVADLPTCDVDIHTASCDYEMANADHAEAIFTNYRIFFRIPLAVQVAQCGVLANLISPVTLMTMIETTTEAPVTTTTEMIADMDDTTTMTSIVSTTMTSVFTEFA